MHVPKSLIFETIYIKNRPAGRKLWEAVWCPSTLSQSNTNNGALTLNYKISVLLFWNSYLTIDGVQQN